MEKGLYCNDKAAGLLFAPNWVGIIDVKDHIKKKEGTEVKDGWFVFHSREAALEFFKIDEN